MGVHTGDSVTVAPQMTLPDPAYQELRDAAIAVVRAVGVDTGGANVQFARERESGELRVIEMNPRVSRSSALASKATGYPIAKVAARLAVGYTLPEIRNDLTGTTPASFEPTLDYVVVKFPRFAFEKFPGVDRTLGTQMKSVGESMGIGRTFPEAFAKARRGLERDPDWRPEGLHPFFAAELDRALPEGPVAFRRVDSCAGEVEAASNYYYSTRGERDDRPPAPGRSVVILGSGPNRIGQGIEFDYCCVHAAASFRAQGYEAVMVNCNPETVSTDYDASERLYFEPLDAEAVLAVLAREAPLGVCIQFGGQTPLRLAAAIERAGYPIMGTPLEAIDLAEDRERFALLAARLGVRCPEWGVARSAAEAVEVARGIGYPVLVRPSYVLGGARMRVCYGPDEVAAAMAGAEGPVLVDRFLEGAVELDVDALCDGRSTHVCAVMEHVEEAGIHSGDSSCLIPAPSDSEEIRALVRRLGPALGVVGLLNVQLALVGSEPYVLEVNPRASRTVPFASKATGVNLVDAACRLAAGATLSDLALPPEGSTVGGHHVKAAVFPFIRFPGADAVLGPEMRSTGEVMASAGDAATAFARAERAAGRALPAAGRAFISVREADKVAVVAIARGLAGLGFELVATAGTAAALELAGIAVTRVEKGEAVVELVARGRVELVVNTPQGRNARRDGYAIREAALRARVPCITTLGGARAALEAIASAPAAAAEPRSLQERHAAVGEVLRAAS
jgi:carbamoyl-phosphate synthase large subunit